MGFFGENPFTATALLNQAERVAPSESMIEGGKRVMGAAWRREREEGTGGRQQQQRVGVGDGTR